MHQDQISLRLHTSSAAVVQRGSNWPMRLASLANAALGLFGHGMAAWGNGD